MMKVSPKPADVTWTDDQWKAIDARGNNILVAAAAGSGKTAVLVERIIRKVISVDNPVDVDRMLIVTFTNAAAAEMRSRIGEALEKELKKNPASLHLRRQLSLLNRANISTLHSFCMKVIRQHYYEVETDPNFRIVDDAEGELIREEIIDELFEEEYGKEDNTEFYNVVDRYSGDRSDDALRSLVRRLYDFSRSHPDPGEWLDEMVRIYDLEDAETIDDLPWTKELLEDVKLQLSGALSWINKGIELASLADGPAKYMENLTEDKGYVEQIVHAANWEDVYYAFQRGGFGRLKSISKKDEVDEVLKERVKGLRDQAKKQVEAVKQDLFLKSPDTMVDELKAMAPSVATLVRLVKEFGRRYASAKKEKALLDFNDLEHLCLEVLGKKAAEKGSWEPTRTAVEFQEHFEEVLTDEYQDTNFVQETILSLLSTGKNRFMVGDVKQSIYRFRLAEPSLFLNKYKTYQKEGESDGWRIDLAKNFRSRCEILDATNYVFRQIMDEAVGEISYDDDAELRHGNMDYPDQDGLETELAIINKGTPLKMKEPGDEQTELEEDLETSQMETRFIIDKIKQLIQSQYPVYDKNLKRTRPVTYRDIVILMRSMPWAATMMDECKKEAIPVYADLSTGYFEAVEVQVMMSLLKVIDNPYQDIPLASVLRSPMYNFDDRELAHIRIMEKGKSYYEALKTTASESPDLNIRDKASHFLDRLESWRTKARSGALSDLIWELYRETGYFSYVGGMPGGKQRQANLRALYDRARAYESTSFRGLFRFLRFIERMQDRGDDLGAARALGEQEDVVRIMTIHKSKGLEFPVVFVAGMNKKFNMRDLHSPYLLHKDLGFGSKFIDPELRVSYPTLPQLAIKKRMHLESLAEEMRVLYVALTRAKEKLYLVGTVNEAEKSLEKWKEFLPEPEWLLPAVDRQKGSSYLDWVGPAVLRHRSAREILAGEVGEPAASGSEIYSDASKWAVQIIEQEDFQKTAEEIPDEESSMEWYLKKQMPVPAESEKRELVNKRLEWQYGYLDSSVHRSKQTVSEVKREAADEYTDTALIKGFKSEYAARPKFLQKKTLSPAEKGTVMHAVMQHISLASQPSQEDVEKKVFMMVEDELLTKEQAESVDTEKISSFFTTELGQQLLQAEWVKREIPFNLGMPASKVYSGWDQKHDDNILIQGIVDCVFRDKDGKLVLIDYKTDKIEGRFNGGFEEALPVLKERYAVQVKLYSEALEQIWGEEVSQVCLYFFDSGKAISMKKGE